MSEKITKRQQAVLDCIESCIREKGYGPTVREVCTALGLSSPSHHHQSNPNQRAISEYQA